MTSAFPQFNPATHTTPTIPTAPAVPAASTVPEQSRVIRSIQGEQAERSTSTRVRASDDDVDAYVDGASDEVLACRERGRHLFPTIRQAGIHFTGVDDTGLLLRRLRCGCCRMAVKVEKWEGLQIGDRTRFRRVTSTLEYRTSDDGQTYLAPTGTGFITPRQVGDAIASQALSGTTLTALHRAAEAAAEAAAESDTEATTGVDD